MKRIKLALDLPIIADKGRPKLDEESLKQIKKLEGQSAYLGSEVNSVKLRMQSTEKEFQGLPDRSLISKVNTLSESIISVQDKIAGMERQIRILPIPIDFSENIRNVEKQIETLTQALNQVINAVNQVATTKARERSGYIVGTPSAGGGEPSDTVVSGTAYGASSAAGTSSEYSRGDHVHGTPADLVTGTAHATLATGIHGAGTATIATTADITTHAALTTVHSMGTMAQAASGDYASTTVYAAHTATDASHGAGTIASVAAVTSQITTHASSTDPHPVYTLKTSWTAKGMILAGSAANLPTGLAIGGTAGYILTVDATEVTGMKWAAAAAGTPSGTVVAETAYAAGSSAGTSAEYSRGDHTHGSPADLVTGTAHASLATGVHGAGTATIAVTADITTHAALTSVHSLGTASTAASASYAQTSTFASHTTAVATHGVAGTIAAKTDITDAGLIVTDVTTNNVTISAHGFVPKSTNNTALFLRNNNPPDWAAPPGGAGILTTTYKSGTQAFSSTALTDVTSLNFACASTTLYHYKFVVMHKTGTATVGMKFSLTYPSSTIAAGRVSMGVTASGTTAYFHGLISASGTAVTGTSQIAANTIGVAIIEGIVRATAAGSIQLQAAAEAAGTVWVMDYSVGLLYAIV